MKEKLCCKDLAGTFHDLGSSFHQQPSPIEEFIGKMVAEFREKFGDTLETVHANSGVLQSFLQDKLREAYSQALNDVRKNWGDLETLSSKFHSVYQMEAQMQGDVRHQFHYEDLPENIKEFDRVLARFVLFTLTQLQEEQKV